jgi:DNA-binding NarL/FixJ family response regulator
VKKAIHAILLEDHPLYREGLRSFLSASTLAIQFEYEGENYLEARDAASRGNIHIAIVDLHLGDGRLPSEIVGTFTSRGIPVLVLSALNNYESVKSAFSMGASGFVTKDSPSEEIIKAIKTVVNGDEWISPVLGTALRSGSGISDKLSAQEKKAAILYAGGLKLEVVARRMDVAPSTVKQYINRVKVKLRAAGSPVSTKTELYKLLRSEGLID